MNSLLDTLRNLGPARLGLMAAVAAGVIAFMIYTTSRIATPDLALLYSDLDATDSSQIVGRLERMEIGYRLSRDGTQIFVPQDQVARLRLTMAEDGLPSGGSIGYEIFDRSESLGTTNFVQNVNHLRALEGELARTIRSISSIKHARVHLVMPKRELFSRERQEPTASIVIAMYGKQTLGKQQIQAIQHLVAAAVPGLKPTMISMVDSNGTLLARGSGESDAQAIANTADEMRVAYEARMEREVEELLERSLGPGNVRVRVTADMDFDRVTENAEIFDPDGQVVRSTQTVEEQSGTSEGEAQPPVTIGGNLPDANLNQGGAAGSKSNALRTEETTNFEISRTVKTHVRESGTVKRLSVAVLINGSTVTGTGGETSYQARKPEEMDQLSSLVRSAVGFDETRGDTLEIVNMPFADPAAGLEGGESGSLFGIPQADLMRIAEILVLGVVAILVLLLVVRPLVGRVIDGPLEGGSGGLLSDQSAGRPALAGPDGATRALMSASGGGGENAADDDSEVVAEEIEQMIDLNKVEGRVRASSVRKIGEIVDKHPDEAVAIIRNWLYQET